MIGPILVGDKDSIHAKLLTTGLSTGAKKDAAKRLGSLLAGQEVVNVTKANPYHDDIGRFCTSENEKQVLNLEGFRNNIEVKQRR